MMKRSKSAAAAPPPALSGEIDLEVRPGGMLVQKRDAAAAAPPAPLVRIRVLHGVARLEVSIGARATFGELKKILEAETGLLPGEQRISYRGKARENREYLDVCGVKNRSKLVLEADSSSLERRYEEMRREARIQSMHRIVSDVSMEVDKLADQVNVIEKSISNGNKVLDVQITTLIESFMRQAVKLESIPTEGSTLPQKNIEAKRVQKCVENLDMLKISNSNMKPVVVTTKWEAFEDPSTTRWEVFD